MKIDKRKLFIIICLALVITVALILIFTTIGKRVKIETPELPVKAFARKVGENVHLTLSKPDGAAYKWFFDDSELANLSVNEKNKAKKQVFVVSSDGSGFVENINFRLKNVNDSNESIYELTVFFIADNGGKLSFYEAKGQKSDPVISGRVGDRDYKIFRDGFNLVLDIAADETDNAESWGVTGGGDGLTIAGPSISDGAVRVIFSKERKAQSAPAAEAPEATDETGETPSQNEDSADTLFTVTVYSEGLTKSIKLNLKVEDSGSVSFISGETADYEIPEIIDEEEKKTFTEKYGVVKLPANAKKVSFGTAVVYDSDEDKKGTEVPEVIFFVDGQMVTYKFSDELKSENDFVREYAAAAGKSETTIKGHKISIIELGGGEAFATWTKGNTKNEVYFANADSNKIKSIIGELV